MKDEMDFCACATPAISCDRVIAEDAAKRPAEYALCSTCGLAIERTATIADLTHEDATPSEYNFCATQPWFPEPVNPWANGMFAQQTGVLVQKRKRCLDDLDDLQRLIMSRIRGSSEERAQAFEATMRQLRGTYREIGRIEQLLAAINPGFAVDKLPSPPSAEALTHKAMKALSRNSGYYAEGFSHAA